ncbi:MAG TPA: nuclear transport factor 2 family protein [Terriglobales bacterium]|nr:nuclear transport factor 2 family protein [Terriglobales bacterium]
MRTLAWWIAGLLLFALPTSAQKKSAAGGSEKAVAALEQQWLKAQQTSNPDLLAPLLADGFTETASDGKVFGKAEALAAIKGSKYNTAEYTDLKVSVFGNTAIATGGFKGSGTDQDGNPISSPERWTDTWVKMPGGKWQCVASHASTAKM